MGEIKLVQFARQVKQEVSKVTWRSRKETIVSTVMVLVMAFIASLFFFAVDGAIYQAVQVILGFEGV